MSERPVSFWAWLGRRRRRWVVWLGLGLVGWFLLAAHSELWFVMDVLQR